MPSVTVIITSAHEPQTINRAVKAVLDQDFLEILEILVVSPDRQTLNAAKESAKNSQKVKLIQDQGLGKPAALNLAFEKAKGEILVLTDGDVYIEKEALKNLLAAFEDHKVGGVCGRPIPLNPRDNIFGFWAHFLTDSAHKIREQKSKNCQFIELSGYLLAIRKKLVKPIPTETLADDLYLSRLVAKNGFKTAYAPKAKVFVKYPTNISDWFAQKQRSAFEYWQKKDRSERTMRSPLQEFLWGIKFLGYPKNLFEIFWLLILFFARAILWTKILILRLFKKRKKELWLPVKSTKS